MKTFRQALQGAGFPITAELAPDHQTTAEELLRRAGTLSAFVDAIQIADNPAGGTQVSPVALAHLLLQQGIDAIPRLDCRDRNRIALQSDLLGLRALGVSSLILEQGEPLRAGSDKARPVFDINCNELVAMAHAISEEQWPDTEHEFLIGTKADVVDPVAGWSPDELLARGKAGARFLQTGPCPDLELLQAYMQQLVESRVTWNYSVIVTLAVDPGQEGVETCARTVRDMANIPGVSGINIPCKGDPGKLIEAIDASGLKKRP